MPTIKERMQQKGMSAIVMSVNFEAQMEALLITEFDGAEEAGYAVEGGVATLKLRGLLAPNVGMDLIAYGLTGYDILVEYINMAREDETVERLRLDVDSDGGFSEGISSVLSALEDLGKPIETYVTGSMNSAAYHIGVVGETIVANEMASIGSIGVYAVHTEYASMFEREGITKRIFKSGYWKGALNNFTKLTEREEERIQRDVDEAAERFFEVVANYRNLSVDVIKGFDGDHFNAKEALTKNLIDEIGDLPMPGENNEAATFTQEQLDAAVAEATKTAMEKMAAHQARIDAINAHPKGSAALKAMFAGQEYQDVSLEKIKEALDVSAPTPEELLEQAGGAGVQPDRTDPPTNADTGKLEKAEKAKEAADTLKSSKTKVL